MFRQLVLVAAGVIAVANAIPFKDDKKGKGGGWGWESEGWGWDDKPAYDINPHFGFRQYSEMRYQPLTVPFVLSTHLPGPPAPPQPLMPLFEGQGPPYSPNLPGPLKFGSLPYSSPFSSGPKDGYLT